MNILNHEVLTEKLQKKPNKSYIQKIQQYEGKRPMTLAKFKATGRKMKYKTYMSNYYKRDISLIDMGLMVERDAEYIYRYVGSMLLQQMGKKYYIRYYNNYHTVTSEAEGEKILYDIIAGHITAPYTKDSTNQ